jgi:hypothetical protein
MRRLARGSLPRGRPVAFGLMAASAIERPAGLQGSVFPRAVSTMRLFVPALSVFTASPPSTFFTTSRGTCSKCVWNFRLARLVLIMEEQ